jgi:hypothetical protein
MSSLSIGKLIQIILFSSGTLGLYKAMQILGYKPYHIYECCVYGGVPHLKVFKEAIIAEFNRLSGVRRYSRADYDKWLADYDVSCYLSQTFARRQRNDLD